MHVRHRKSRSKEREILEALQNGKDPAELAKHYPPLQVERLNTLHKVAVDASHRDFIKAQVLVREILERSKAGEGDGDASEGRHEVTLLHGTLGSVPLPGTPVPGAAHVNGTPAGSERVVSPLQAGKSDPPRSS